MHEFAQYIGIALLMLLWLYVAIKVAFRYIKSRYGKVRTVNARVVDKHTSESFDKYKGNGKHLRYVVVFDIEGKRKAFYVSEFSYGLYRLNETGMLKYQGNRLIDFR